MPRNGGPFHSYRCFRKALEKRGFEKLGAGCFSAVLAKPGSDRVIKVTSKEDGWIDYIFWAAKKGYAGTLAPKVYSFKEIKDRNGGIFYVSVMERIEKVHHAIPREQPIKLAETLIHYTLYDNKTAAHWLDLLQPNLSAFCKDIKDTFRGLDFHGANMMVRKDGSLCITDPICMKPDTAELMVTSKRLKTHDFAAA